MRPTAGSTSILVFVVCILGFGCGQESIDSPALDLSQIELPSGFAISLYAAKVPNARSLSISPGGTLFVGTRQKDYIYALRDSDGDFVVDQQFQIGKGFVMPNGVAFRDGALYVAEVNRIWRFDDIEAVLDKAIKTSETRVQDGTLTEINLSELAGSAVIYDGFPSDRHHGWKYIAFGPDGKLYVPVGSPCNVCDRGDPYGTITRMNVDGSGFEIVARGVRNSVGFDWHPESDEMWFTDNGRDNLGDDIPSDEINRMAGPENHFGFPYVHAGTILDPEFGQDKSASDYSAPVQLLGAHKAALGMEFYTGSSFPEAYRNKIFIAEHGSWNRSEKVGYQLSVLSVHPDSTEESYTPFAKGWLQGETAWGRPVDVELLPDGSMLISDDLAGAIYRISYAGS